MILTKKNIVIVSVVSILLVAIYLLLVFPSVQNILDKKQYVDELTTEMTDNYIERPPINKVIRDLEFNQQEINVIYEKSVITNENQLAFIQFLEECAGSDVSQTTVFDLSAKKEEGLISKAPISIELKTTYPEFVNYLDRLEHSDYYVEINSIVIDRLRTFDEHNRPIPMVKATISGQIFTP